MTVGDTPFVPFVPFRPLVTSNDFVPLTSVIDTVCPLSFSVIDTVGDVPSSPRDLSNLSPHSARV